ncbi:MAG: hypothetical protein AMXMBFR13_35830 [Phycisphaerae bacterium]
MQNNTSIPTGLATTGQGALCALLWSTCAFGQTYLYRVVAPTPLPGDTYVILSAMSKNGPEEYITGVSAPSGVDVRWRYVPGTTPGVSSPEVIDNLAPLAASQTVNDSGAMLGYPMTTSCNGYVSSPTALATILYGACASQESSVMALTNGTPPLIVGSAYAANRVEDEDSMPCVSRGAIWETLTSPAVDLGILAPDADVPDPDPNYNAIYPAAINENGIITGRARPKARYTGLEPKTCAFRGSAGDLHSLESLQWPEEFAEGWPEWPHDHVAYGRDININNVVVGDSSDLYIPAPTSLGAGRACLWPGDSSAAQMLERPPAMPAIDEVSSGYMAVGLNDYSTPEIVGMYNDQHGEGFPALWLGTAYVSDLDDLIADPDCMGKITDVYDINNNSKILAHQGADVYRGVLLVPTTSDADPFLVSAVSRKTHGSAGDFDVNLMPGTGTPAEDRVNGPTRLVFTFNEAVTPSDGTLDDEVLVSSGTILNMNLSCKTLTVNLYGVPDQSCLCISLSGLVDNRGKSLTGTTTLDLAVLYCDVNGDMQVASGDVTQVKSRSGQTTSESNFRCDVNADGQIASGDITAVKAASGNSVVCP